MRKIFVLLMLITALSGLAACKKNPIAIADNDYKKSLPDAACNSADNNFFVFWAAVPGDGSTATDNSITGQKFPASGRSLVLPLI